MGAEVGSGVSTRTATIVFTDLVGSTAQRSRLGDDAADALRREHDDIAAAVAADGGGEVVKGTGDGVMLAFDSASGAVAAAVALQQAVAARNIGTVDPIGVRVGLGAGDVSVEGGDLFGMPVVEAARLCDQADAGQVFVSELVRLLCGSRGGHEFSPAGERELKGIDGPITVFEVLWAMDDVPGLVVPRPLRSSEALVGRSDELGVLTASWTSVCAGGRAAVMVAGEPGIGKTRLASALAQHASSDGGLVLYGRCEDGMAVAYQPIAAAIRRFLTDHPDSAGTAFITEHAADFAPLLPGLVDAPASPAADAEELRWRLFEVVREFLEVLSAGQPLVVVLDDLHWATDSTVLLVRHILSTMERGRVLAVLMYRDTEDNVVLSDLFADLGRLEAPRVHLTGLSEAQVATLAGGGLLDATAVHAATRGNPFYVREIAKSAGEASVTPTAVHDVVMSRIRRLGGQALDALTAASVVGPEFELAVLEQVAGTDLLDALESAVAAGLVGEAAEVPGMFRFEHDLTRQTLRDQLSATRRSRMHAKVADALESLGAPFASPVRLAGHLLAAATPGRAGALVEAARAAVEDLSQRLAFDEAIRLGDAALAAAEGDGSAAPVPVVELMLAVAQCDLTENRLDPVRERVTRAAELALATERTDLAAWAAMIALAEAEAGRLLPEIVQLGEDVLRLDLEDVWRSRVLSALAKHRASSAEGAGARTIARDAFDLACAVDDPVAIVQAGIAVVFAENTGAKVSDLLDVTRRMGEARHRIESGTEDGEISSQFRQLTIIHAGLIEPHVAMAVGDRAPVTQLAAGLDSLAPTARWEAFAAQIRGFIALLDGRWVDAAGYAGQMMGLVGSHLNMELSASAQLLASSNGSGDLAPLVDLLAALAAEHPGIAGYRAAWALGCTKVGDLVAAREVFEPLCRDGFAAIAPDYLQPGSLAVAADACARIANCDAASALLRLLDPHEGSVLILGTLVWAPGAADRYRAMLLALLGDDRFDDAYAAALALERQIQSDPLCAETSAWWARDLLRRGRDGDQVRAAELATDARAVAARLGMDGLLRDLDEWGFEVS